MVLWIELFADTLQYSQVEFIQSAVKYHHQQNPLNVPTLEENNARIIEMLI